jgi:hypothetical protein
MILKLYLLLKMLKRKRGSMEIENVQNSYDDDYYLIYADNRLLVQRKHPIFALDSPLTSCEEMVVGLIKYILFRKEREGE